MNEQIKKLAEQAGIYQPDRFDAIDGSNQMKKFAELIVKECASLCLDMKTILHPQPHHYAVMIKEHFGVEE